MRDRSGVRTRRATAAAEAVGKASWARRLLIGGAVLLMALAVVLLVALL